MANTLTDLTPDIYQGMDTVSRELVGMIPAVTINGSLARAALNQPVRSFVTNPMTASNLTPGQLPDNNGDHALGNVILSIQKERYVPIKWNGNEQFGMDSGPGYNNILREQFEQAFRALTNEIEGDLTALYTKASRGMSPAGTSLFATDTVYKDIANVRKILVDNGAPLGDMQLVLNTNAGAALRGNPRYAGANTAGTDTIQRQGILLDMSGMAIRESAQGIENHTAGTAANATTDDAGYAVGAREITLDAVGTGNIKKGDRVTFGSTDKNEYVVTEDVSAVSGATIKIQEPGLRVAIPATETTVAVVTGTEANLCFHRGAIHLAVRAPALPQEGDSAIDRILVQDPRSNLVFEISKYLEHRQVKYEVGAAWGVQVVQPRHFALLTD